MIAFSLSKIAFFSAMVILDMYQYKNFNHQKYHRLKP